MAQGVTWNKADPVISKTQNKVSPSLGFDFKESKSLILYNPENVES